MRSEWLERRRARKYCFHHDPGRPTSASQTAEATSWIRSELIDLGRRKMFWCEEAVGGCGRKWIV